MHSLAHYTVVRKYNMKGELADMLLQIRAEIISDSKSVHRNQQIAKISFHKNFNENFQNN